MCVEGIFSGAVQKKHNLNISEKLSEGLIIDPFTAGSRHVSSFHVLTLLVREMPGKPWTIGLQHPEGRVPRSSHEGGSISTTTCCWTPWSCSCPAICVRGCWVAAQLSWRRVCQQSNALSSLQFTRNTGAAA